MRYINKHIRPGLILLVSALFVTLMIPGVLHAATITVDETIDDDPAVDNGLCSLREAITSANTDTSVDSCNTGESTPFVDEIVIEPGLDGMQIVLEITGLGEDSATTENLDITEDLQIIGNELLLTAFSPLIPEIQTLLSVQV